ncbi:MAG TPA: hypothetical protein PKH45_03290 [Tenuifilaceae bacterium]|nr:hypothetical protein [Tenuifilaceae bacterium]
MLRRRTYRIQFFMVIATLAVASASCSPKVYPSGLEGNLFGYQKNFQREQLKRKFEATRNNIKMARQKRKAMRPLKAQAHAEEKMRKQLYAEHIAKQEPHVQMRMKQNLKETEKKYPSKNTLRKKLLFWKKNSCPNGFR